MYSMQPPMMMYQPHQPYCDGSYYPQIQAMSPFIAPCTSSSMNGSYLTPLAQHQQKEPLTAQPNAVVQQDIVVVKRGRGRPPKKPKETK